MGENFSTVPESESLRLLWCDRCAQESLFEQPDCVDGHQDCPEWVCTECGHALVLAVLVPAELSAAELMPLVPLGQLAAA